MPYRSTALPNTWISMDGEARSATEEALRWVWRLAIALLVFLIVALAWFVVLTQPYESGSDLGYNLGLTGGLLMACLLLYPLRKRVPALERLASMEAWFKFHVVAGIAGPLLVLFHSTFRTGSMNGRTGLYAMMLVALSGVVGRFIYRHLYHGLHGQQLGLAEAQEALNTSARRLGSVFALREDIEPRLRAFHDEAFAPLEGLWPNLWRFLTLRRRSRRLADRVHRDAKKVLRGMRRAERRPKAELRLSYRLARAQIDGYLDCVVRTSQLSTWERLFSLWSLIHLPFSYLFVLSAIVHVVAVHMY